ncbi:MAG: hypothetical protein R2857_01820 [Vampirovibrionales bacterium]
MDDEASIRRILETRFKMLSYETVVAADGEEALQVFEQFGPDIVFYYSADAQDGRYGVTKEIRKNSDTYHHPHRPRGCFRTHQRPGIGCR